MSRNYAPTLVVMGMMGRTPVAGVAWQGIQYLEGFRRLGFDVYYVEDTRVWPYDPVQNTVTDDCRYTLAYLERVMGRCGMAGRWAYRAEPKGGRLFGMDEAQLARLFDRAEALVNLTGATLLRDEHLRVPVRIYLETDPVLPQIEVALGNRFTIDLLSAHTHHFSYGENFGAADCGVPVRRFTYHPTRPPIVLDWWSSPPPARPAGRPRFTTVGSWKQEGKDINWEGETYAWSKHHEFLKFLDLPRRTAHRLELAMACEPEVTRLLSSHGWQVVDGLALSLELSSYREYIRGSWGEFTIAKDQNIRLRSGWFSDRSASYLAAGRPVVSQDTGFGRILPTGRGLFAFRSMEDILAALDAIADDYPGQSRAASEIAAEYFAAERVLGEVCERAGVSARAGRGGGG